MRTVICDLDRSARAGLGLDERCDVVIGREQIEASHACVGCFGCWTRTPGRCVLRDGLVELGPLLGATDELWVIAENSFGGYGGLVKRALERALPYLHPNFRIAGGQMHHRLRYPRTFTEKIWLYGPTTARERSCFERLSAANAVNQGAQLRGVWFPADPCACGLEERSDEPAPEPEHLPTPLGVPRHVALLNASPRGEKSATHALLADFWEALGVYAGESAPAFVGEDSLSRADTLVLGYPLYVDAPPSGLIERLERWARERTLAPGTRVYAISNLGFYEADQILPSFTVLENFCRATGGTWCGGLAVGGGGMVLPTTRGPRMGRMRQSRSEAIDQLVFAALAGQRLDAALEARCPVPRLAYKLAAETGWRKARVDLDARPAWQPESTSSEG